MCKKDTNIFTVIGIIVASLAAAAGIAVAVYHFVIRKRCLCDGDCYDFDCDGCDEDCSECPIGADAADEDEDDSDDEQQA